MNPSQGTLSSRRVAKTPCPKCNGPLMNVSGWSWCHRCGHREESQTAGSVETSLESPASSPAKSSSEVGLAFRLIPSWAWLLLIGLSVVVGASFLADYYLPERSRVRAIWSSVQVLVEAASGVGSMAIEGPSLSMPIWRPWRSARAAVSSAQS